MTVTRMTDESGRRYIAIDGVVYHFDRREVIEREYEDYGPDGYDVLRAVEVAADVYIATDGSGRVYYDY